MKIYAKKWWETPQRRRGKFWDQMGNLNIEAKCMQEDVEREGATCRYWSQMTAENWWQKEREREREAGERGEVRHRNKMSARSCGETRGQSSKIETAKMQEVAERHRCGATLDIEWYRNKMHAKKCGEAKGGTRYETNWMTWMQAVVEGHRGEI